MQLHFTYIFVTWSCVCSCYLFLFLFFLIFHSMQQKQTKTKGKKNKEKEEWTCKWYYCNTSYEAGEWMFMHIHSCMHILHDHTHYLYNLWIHIHTMYNRLYVVSYTIHILSIQCCTVFLYHFLILQHSVFFSACTKCSCFALTLFIYSETIFQVTLYYDLTLSNIRT